MNSRVHPKFKTRYRVTNWSEYDRSLVQRGDITMWISPAATKAWKAKSSGKRGAPKKYSNIAIETALTLRAVFRLPLRQAEGFLRSLLELMDIDLNAPDHTTLSRRAKDLRVDLRLAHSKKGIHLIVDSTGLSIVGEGEWAAAKHGNRGKRGWRKLHLGVSRSGQIIAQVLTDSSVDDPSTGLKILNGVRGKPSSVTGDAAYDTVAIYDAASSRGAQVVVAPTRNASVAGREPRSTARDRTIRRVDKVGRRRWKKESGSHRQGAVENAFYRYKSINGDRLRARDPLAQATEAAIACNVLNRMFEMGRPKSVAIPR
jgi:IS5 family transposase